ncbi:hypothetical protein [Lysinibacillus sp. 54212]|uniref:hypothetical protein n=1 Tax=Lysinibacillus sp. 54212 TaxID=3119829 RepID=UPI002FC9734A
MKQADVVEQMAAVNTDIQEERRRQNAKWGIQRHSYGEWLAILGEEFGEVCQAINGIHFPEDSKPTDANNLYEELIQLAAVAAAIAEQVKEESEA